MDTIAISDSRDESSRRSRTYRLASGRTIGYAEYGAPHGLPVFALHGTPGSRLMFALADLTAHELGLRLVAPDRPGYGLSPYRHGDSLMSLARDVEALADALGLDRFALIGVSGGGPHAAAAAALMPGRTRLLALIAPVGPIAECRETILMSKLHRLVFTRMAKSALACTVFFTALRGLGRAAPAIAYRGLMQRVTPSDRAQLARPEVKASLLAALNEGLRPGVKGVVQDLRLYCAPWGFPLATIEAPAIVWQGSADPIVPAEAAYYLAGTLPKSRLEVVQGAGHYWVFEGFATVLDVIAATLRAA